MKQKGLRRAGAVLLVLVFVGSGIMAAKHLYDQHLAKQAYAEAERAVLSVQEEPAPEEELLLPEEPVPLDAEPEGEPLPEEAEFLLDVDLNVLRQTNEDVLGWICIPDSEVSYPLMRSRDNQEYLKLTWDRKPNSAGSIFLERKNSAALGDFHTLVYGHNMKDNSMFGRLSDYRKPDFAEAHPHIYIVTDEAVLQYEVFSGYTADVVSDTYRLYFEDDARKQSVIDFYLEKSELEPGVVPTTEDRILTLSTCTFGRDDVRWVVHGVLTGTFPKDA